MAATLVARKPLKVAGKRLVPGDTIDLDVLPPRRVQRMLDVGYIKYAAGESDISSAGDALRCDICNRVFKSPQGVGLHQRRVHKE